MGCKLADSFSEVKHAQIYTLYVTGRELKLDPGGLILEPMLLTIVIYLAKEMTCTNSNTDSKKTSRRFCDAFEFTLKAVLTGISLWKLLVLSFQIFSHHYLLKKWKVKCPLAITALEQNQHKH